jgi:hypothetical protein
MQYICNISINVYIYTYTYIFVYIYIFMGQPSYLDYLRSPGTSHLLSQIIFTVQNMTVEN